MTQVTDAPARTRAQIAERTLRKDRWWQAPAVAAALLTIWVAYATVRVFTGHWYFVEQYHYLTPFYSPCVNGECVPGSSTLGTWISAIPPIIPYAFVSLPILVWVRPSCHSCRHITGGRLKHFSKHPARYWAWTQISKLNAKHMQLAWTTLGTLMLTDLYVMLVAAHAFNDLRIFN